MTDANEQWDQSWGQERDAETRTLEHNLADYKCRALDAERELEEARAELDYLLQTHEATCQNRDEARAEVERLREAAQRVVVAAWQQQPGGFWLHESESLEALRAALGTKP